MRAMVGTMVVPPGESSTGGVRPLAGSQEEGATGSGFNWRLTCATTQPQCWLSSHFSAELPAR